MLLFFYLLIFLLILQSALIKMTSQAILSVFAVYIILLFLVSWLTSRKADNQTYYTGNRKSPWLVVAYGMTGASLSGVTFMSVPGWVRDTQFSYMLVVFGYMAGYFIIALVLLPLYYKLNLTSIYTYLEKRLGYRSYKTGAGFFILSRLLGTSLRLFLVISVLHTFIFDSWNIPFWLSDLVIILLVVLYTLRGGIRTIVYTDTVQTTFMLLAVILSIVYISHDLGTTVNKLFISVAGTPSTKMFITDWHNERFFLKQFLSGVFITIAMTGLDQEMMQKNLSCRNLRAAQKNMFTFSFILVLVNFMFLFLGAVLLVYANSRNIEVRMSDELFPVIAFNHLAPVAGIVFLIGLVSAALPSAGGAMTSLTTSVTIDFLGLNPDEGSRTRMRYLVHVLTALGFFICILIFRSLSNRAVIDQLITLAGYTYGPLLGMFTFGLFTGRKAPDKATPWIALFSPLACYLLSTFSEELFNGYRFGFEILLLNGFLTFAGLMLLSRREPHLENI